MIVGKSEELWNIVIEQIQNPAITPKKGQDRLNLSAKNGHFRLCFPAFFTRFTNVKTWGQILIAFSFAKQHL